MHFHIDIFFSRILQEFSNSLKLWEVELMDKCIRWHW